MYLVGKLFLKIILKFIGAFVLGLIALHLTALALAAFHIYGLAHCVGAIDGALFLLLTAAIISGVVLFPFFLFWGSS